jgi:hypothetical protein
VCVQIRDAKRVGRGAGGGGGRVAGGVMAGFLQFSFHSLLLGEKGERVRGQFNINSLLAGSSAKAWDENIGVN